ncbi:MAG: CPBP family glutamic-type intramembrane protease [Bdellovibrionales bacterium]
MGLKTYSNWLGALLLAIYVIFREGFDYPFWANKPSYWSYIAEILFVLLVFVSLPIDRNQFKSFKIKYDLYALVFLGLMVHWFGTSIGIVVPLDLEQPLTVALLLLVAPLLEELVFRFALWECFQNIVKKPVIIIVFTALLFSLSHFKAVFYLPKEFHPFIIYQTIYTLLLGLILGWQKHRRNSLPHAITGHFYFNLGFYLATII